MQIREEHVRIAKVVGENEDGLTLFVPKDMDGTFHLTEGDRFLTLAFMRNVGGRYKFWLPWRD